MEQHERLPQQQHRQDQRQQLGRGARDRRPRTGHERHGERAEHEREIAADRIPTPDELTQRGDEQHDEQDLDDVDECLHGVHRVSSA